MRVRTLVTLIGIAVIAVFVALNWSAFVTPTGLNLIFASVEAPLGIVMLVILVTVVLLFAAYMAVWQSTVMIESRRQAKELQTHRALAEQAENSRFTELRGELASEVGRVMERIESAKTSLAGEIEAGVNSLSAMIGEMDERARRKNG